MSGLLIINDSASIEFSAVFHLSALIDFRIGKRNVK